MVSEKVDARVRDRDERRAPDVPAAASPDPGCGAAGRMTLEMWLRPHLRRARETDVAGGTKRAT
jgi:hypothetical protein